MGGVVILRVLTLDDWPLWRAVRLAVFRDNEPAIALYERHGFVAAGDAAGQVVMAKTLR
jgi:ribosomal protein S18 acetylase RimI-like enzyme